MGRAVRLLLAMAISGWIAGAPVAAQEGLSVDPRHRALKESVQNRPAYDDSFPATSKALGALIGEYEAARGRDSLEVGLLLLDLGELLVRRVEHAAQADRAGLLRRGVRALEAGDRIVAGVADRFEEGPAGRSRALFHLGLGLKNLGDASGAEAALREGLTVHWRKYADHRAQMKFFEPLYAVTPLGPAKVRTAETWLKFADAYGSGFDKEAARTNLEAARDLTPAAVAAAEVARARAERLAATGDEGGAYGVLAKAFAGRRPGERRVLVARTKPAFFEIYSDPRAGRSTSWGDGVKPLSPYDRVATRFFTDHGLMPFVSEGRNNLLTLLTLLGETYRTGDADTTRRLCRLIPDTYARYSRGRLPEACLVSSWADWHLSMGGVDPAKELLAMAIDLAGREGDAQAASAEVEARTGLALLEARYGSPDDFLQALDALDARAGGRALPTALHFYAGILRDDPAEVRTALAAAGRFDGVRDQTGPVETGRTRDAGERLRDRLGMTGRKVASYLCEAPVPGLPPVVKAVQCQRAARPGAPPRRVETGGLDGDGLLVAAAPEIVPILKAVGSAEVLRRLDHDSLKPILGPPTGVNRQILDGKLTPDDIHRLGEAQYDVERAGLAQIFIERHMLELGRRWAEAAYIHHQTLNGGATIFSLWLLEGFRERRYREGWIWLGADRPVLAEAAFGDFVPGPAKVAEAGSSVEFDWTRTLGALHGRMLARVALGDRRGALEDARALINFARKALERQSFSRFETRDLVARAAQRALGAAVGLLTGERGELDRSVAKGDFDAAFVALQLMRPTTTATTVTRLAARLSGGAPDLAVLARRREELRLEWERARGAAAADDGEPQRRARRLGDELAAIDARMRREFPAYVELAGTTASTADQAAGALGDGRSLFGFAIDGTDVYLTALSSVAGRIVRLDHGLPALQTSVRDLRRSLEPRGGHYLLFRAEAGRAVFRQVVRPVADVLTAPGIHTMVEVTQGPLDGIPLSVLPTEAEGRFLIDDVASERLPSVSSLVLLAGTKAPLPEKPFLGVGDPVLEGDPAQSRGVEQEDVFAAAGTVDLARLRNLARLPETATEITRLSQLLKAGPDSIVLRAEATEAALRRRPLRDYRVIAFATHGLLAGEYSGIREPGLVMTPPATATEEDDGYLSASEIAALDLSADIVLLSACNTAAANGAEGAEGLSGLSKAFFFAGARGLLVSHWKVHSDAAVALTTRMIEGRQAGSTVSYARALRAAILALRKEAGDDGRAHPGFWGPFQIVGG